MPVRLICRQCQQPFTVPPSGVRHRQFCRRHCRTLWSKAHPGARRPGHQRIQWEPWQLDLVRRHYDSKPATITRLVEQLHLPRRAVLQCARRLGVARTKEPAWSEADLEYLHRHLATMSFRALARRLGRTETAVRIKVKRVGITKRSIEGYTARELERLLGIEVHAILRWIASGHLAARRRQMAKANDEYCISDGAVKTFIVHYRQEIDLRRVDRDWFIDLLADGSVHVASPREPRMKELRHA